MSGMGAARSRGLSSTKTTQSSPLAARELEACDSAVRRGRSRGPAEWLLPCCSLGGAAAGWVGVLSRGERTLLLPPPSPSRACQRLAGQALTLAPGPQTRSMEGTPDRDGLGVGTNAAPAPPPVPSPA